MWLLSNCLAADETAPPQTHLYSSQANVRINVFVELSMFFMPMPSELSLLQNKGRHGTYDSWGLIEVKRQYTFEML